jgi:hypothetical protein
LRLDLGATWDCLGRLLERDRQWGDALAAYTETLEHERRVWGDGPKERFHCEWLNQRYEAVLHVLCELNRGPEAEALQLQWEAEPDGR